MLGIWGISFSIQNIECLHYFFFVIVFLAAPGGRRDPSFWTGDWTCAPCSGTAVLTTGQLGKSHLISLIFTTTPQGGGMIPKLQMWKWRLHQGHAAAKSRSDCRKSLFYTLSCYMMAFKKITFVANWFHDQAYIPALFCPRCLGKDQF